MVHNALTKKAAWSPMGSTANINGRLIAQNMMGAKLNYNGVLGTAVCKLPGLNVGNGGAYARSIFAKSERVALQVIPVTAISTTLSTAPAPRTCIPLDKDEKILLVCNKGKRAYLLQNRMKYYGYTNTKVLEGGITFSEVKA